MRYTEIADKFKSLANTFSIKAEASEDPQDAAEWMQASKIAVESAKIGEEIIYGQLGNN